MRASRIVSMAIVFLVLLSIFLPGGALGAQAAQSGAAKPASAPNADIIKHTQNMKLKSLADRPDTDIVEFKNGRHISLGDLRRLDASVQKMRAPRVDKMPAVLKVKPNANNVKMRMNSASDLASALKLSDNETVQLPSGRLATVGQIKLVQPLVEKRLGHSLASLLQRSNLSGPAIKITSATTKDQWIDIWNKPDATVLEAPDGQRFTVGEAKQYMASKFKTAPSAGPTKKVPALTPKQK
jgi:hypothetical protein